MRVAPDIRGIMVLPDDGKTLFVRLGQAEDRALANAREFERALEESLPASEVPTTDRSDLRRAVRVTNLAELNTGLIAKVVLAISMVGGLAADPPWTDAQQEMITSAADWIERTFALKAEAEQVGQAIRRIRQTSIRRRVRRLPITDELSELWDDWDAPYEERSRLFHGGGGNNGERRGGYLRDSELHALDQEALTLSGRIVLSLAKRDGMEIPSRAVRHFGVP